MLLGIIRMAKACQKRIKVPVLSQKWLGRNFGLLFEKIGLLFDQTVWSHWMGEYSPGLVQKEGMEIEITIFIGAYWLSI